MRKLAVAIIHYHLRPGGVTRVVERAVESLNDEVDVLCLTGEAPAPGAELTPITEPYEALAYSENSVLDSGKLAEDLRFTARSLLGRDPDVWHIHNHSLGKNSFTPQLVWHLAKAGCRLLLQPHDFAEDGRPENYRLLKEQLGNELDAMLYPTADHVWYAPINYRDKSFLEDIGLPNVHELPNAVTQHAGQAFQPALGRQECLPHIKTIVYPARAIRRKNMGEFLLWSLLAPEGYLFQSTLAPQNPKWQGHYKGWEALAEELNLPVEFDAGRKHDFGELIRNAEALMTTSIQEGFGLAFLEPWLEGKMLIGRKLPEITTDFEQEGLDLSSLYDALPIPLEWAGEKAFHTALETAMRASAEAYSKMWVPETLDEAKAALVIDGKVDFGVLDEELQQNVIRHLVAHPEDRKQLPPFAPSPNLPLIERNRQVALDQYSLDAYGERLLGLYRALAATQPGDVGSADASALLDRFQQPQRFNLLRT
ncbi:Mannosylglucosyl-3-phosphoglycerate synthase [Pontiella desulfatans]|uniref:Mannosylglucosyl-3-phosphoglycerate synthase n=1 Tax=Pontiella desulfatans TaxID=2750659 RepID=A0A6C2TZY2_PONDE|nr:glycosyltransferase family 4 protein [Pontiella desulfatans]VGO12726.1 Mannosylglucosyl-3-phosphoglycerate synthase [Pontiella desulfatans]